MHKFKDEFNRYFPEYDGIETKCTQSMVQNPFNIKVDELPNDIQEDIIELQNDRNCNFVFESVVISKIFCVEIKNQKRLCILNLVILNYDI